MSAYKHPDDKVPDLNPSSVPVSAGFMLNMIGWLFFIAVLAAFIGVIIK